MPTTATTPSRIAHLEDSDRDDYPHVVHGVAHGEEELTLGKNSPKYWPADEVEQAAATLEGAPVYKGTHDGGREQVGAVLRAAYEPGVGVVYEAGLEDPEVAEELSIGQREVSIEAANAESVDQHESGAIIMRGYEYTGLATPEKGASRSNYTTAGPAEDNPAVAALSAGDIADALDGDLDVEAALNSFDSVAGVSFRGTRDGKLDESAIPNDDYEPHYLFDGDTKSASSYPVVDADGYLRRGNVAAAYSVGPRGDVSRDELYDKLQPLNEAFSTAPIAPEKLSSDEATAAASALHADAGAVLAALADMPGDDPVSPERGQGEAGTGGQATPDDGDSMTNGSDNDHDVEALLERVDEKDDRIETLESDLEETEAELEEKEDRIDDLSDEVDEAKRAYAARLAEHNDVLDEDDLVEKFELAELRAKFDDLEEELASDPDPDPDPDVQSGGGNGSQTAALSDLDDDTRAELEAAKDRYEHWQGKNETMAQAEADEIAELAGVDSVEEIDLEAI